ncbi:MAG TPA: SCO family protein [Bryobacteraceae bacterium]|nr:SCO family protein [Bryobacteraceae bacterium]
MTQRKYISAVLAVAGTLVVQSLAVPFALGQDNLPGYPEPMSSSEERLTVSGPRNLAPQDLLNMKMGDRPLPLKSVTIEQKLDSQLPLDAPFRDETGKTVPLGAYFGKRPVVLALVYYECPMLCTQVLNGVVRAAKVLRFTAGADYDVVAISFDARETPAQAAAKKAVYMKSFGHPEANASWHFLTGDVNSVKRVTDAVGFRYTWDVHTAQFAHASAIYVLTPEGKLSKYFYGIDYSPKDMRLALVEASNNKIGNPVDQILLFCYHFDPHSAKYTPYALGLLRVAGGATVLMLGGFVFIMLRRENRQKGSRAA